MFKNAEMRKNVFASVIASIIVIILIQPILTSIFRLMNFLGANVYIGFSNQIYSNAALGERTNIVFMVFTWILVISTLFVLSMTVLVLTDREQGIDSSLEETKPSENSRSDSTTNNSQRGRRIIKVGIAVCCALFVLSSLVSLTLEFTNLQLNTSFRQRLTVLAPKLTDQQVKELKASWASMKSRSDFDSLTNYMNELAKARNVQLPSPLLAGG